MVLSQVESPSLGDSDRGLVRHEVRRSSVGNKIEAGERVSRSAGETSAVRDSIKNAAKTGESISELTAAGCKISQLAGHSHDN